MAVSSAAAPISRCRKLFLMVVVAISAAHAKREPEAEGCAAHPWPEHSGRPIRLLLQSHTRRAIVWDDNRSWRAEGSQEGTMGKTDVWQGTLALMVLTTLESTGSMHGYGIARRIEETSGDLLQLNYGTLYPARSE